MLRLGSAAEIMVERHGLLDPEVAFKAAGTSQFGRIDQ